MINKKTVKHIARLARLGVSAKDIEKFQKELSAILGFVEKLQELDTTETEPMAQATETINVFRADKARPASERFRKQFLKNLPAKEKNYIKVPPILE